MNGTAIETGRYFLSPDHALHRLQRGALIAGVLGLALSGAGALISPVQFFRSYLVAYLFWFGIALGCMSILMIHHITGGAWGAVIRRLLESGTRTLPLLAFLFLPVILGMRELYTWARPDVVAHDLLLQHQALYLNVPFFLIRAVFYFAVWLTLSGFLNRWSLQQDHSLDAGPGRWLEQLSRGGLVLVGLTMTFASIDWVMSLEPHWSSTIYGIIFLGGQVLAAMAFIIPLAALLADGGPLTGVISAEQFQDLGKLLLAFVMLWAYFAFSQFLITWSGNLTEEIPWYLARFRGGWGWVGLAVLVLQFVVPFALLLSRTANRNPRILFTAAALLVAVRFADICWLVLPAFSPQHFAIHWMDIFVPAGLGGLWIAVFASQIPKRPLLPTGDPEFAEAMAHGPH